MLGLPLATYHHVVGSHVHIIIDVIQNVLNVTMVIGTYQAFVLPSKSACLKDNFILCAVLFKQVEMTSHNGCGIKLFISLTKTNTSKLENKHISLQLFITHQLVFQ